MRKYTFKIVFALLAMASFFACETVNDKVLDESNFHVKFEKSDAEIVENIGDDRQSVNLLLSAATQSSDIEITYKVSGTAVAGEDYILHTPTTVVIEAGSHVLPVEFTILDNEDADGTKTIIFEIESVSGGLAAGLGLVGKSFSATINDDDCPVGLAAGTYAVKEDWGDGEVYEYDTEVTIDAADRVVFYMDNYWGGGMTLKMVFDPCNELVDIPDQKVSDDLYGYGEGRAVKNGEGFYSAEANTITFDALTYVSAGSFGTARFTLTAK